MKDTSKFGQPIRLGNLPSDPASPEAGSIYFNTTSFNFRSYNGTIWSDLGSGGGGSGANLTLSNLTSPTSINQDLLPSSDLSRDIGSASLVWDTAYASRIMSKENHPTYAFQGTLTNLSNLITSIGPANVNYLEIGQTLSHASLLGGTQITRIDYVAGIIEIDTVAQANAVATSINATMNNGLVLETVAATISGNLKLLTGEGDITGNILLQTGRQTSGGIRGSASIDAGSLYLANNTKLVFAESEALAAPNQVSIRLPTLVASYDLILPVNQGAAATILTNDGSGNLSWAAPAATGANTSLSNLTTTSINQDLLPSGDATRVLGSAALRWTSVYTNALRQDANNYIQLSGLAYSGGNKKIDWSGNDVTVSGTNFIRADGPGSLSAIIQTYVHSISLSANVVTPTIVSGILGVGVTSFRTIHIDYAVREATTNKQRGGKIIIVTDGTNVAITENFAETAQVGNATGLTFTAVISAGNIFLQFNNTHATNACTMRADVKYFSA